MNCDFLGSFEKHYYLVKSAMANFWAFFQNIGLLLFQHLVTFAPSLTLSLAFSTGRGQLDRLVDLIAEEGEEREGNDLPEDESGPAYVKDGVVRIRSQHRRSHKSKFSNLVTML